MYVPVPIIARSRYVYVETVESEAVKHTNTTPPRHTSPAAGSLLDTAVRITLRNYSFEHKNVLAGLTLRLFVHFYN